jgi:adenylosuccinate synthase
VKPVYEKLPGWREPLTGIRKFDELPKTVRDYVDFIEDFLRVRATIVSVGPARDQTITR